MTSIGETLRRERLRRGWSLEKVASETKISLHLLEAIEADQFDRLPGGVFARNFVRQYARMLQIDEDELLAAFRQQFEEPAESEPEPEAAPSYRRESPLTALTERLGPSTSLSAFVGLVVVILACSGAYSLWQRTRATRRAPETVAAAPRSKPQPEPPAHVITEAPKPEFRPAEVSESGTIRVPEKPVSKPPVTPAQNPKPAVAPVEPPAPEVRAGSMRVSFTATEPVWVSIKSDGTRAYTGMIEAQQTRQFDANRKMTALVGNAGSVDIALNGKSVGPIGAKGEIQLVVLTPSGAHVVPRTPRTSDDSTAAPTEPASSGERP